MQSPLRRLLAASQHLGQGDSQLRASLAVHSSSLRLVAPRGRSPLPCSFRGTRWRCFRYLQGRMDVQIDTPLAMLRVACHAHGIFAFGSVAVKYNSVTSLCDV